jgi:hypothetical protein
MVNQTIRQRFDQLRSAMSWSWADIDRITGRKFTRTNISKGVPNWARLAINTHESYQNILRLHLLDSLRLRLGFEWSLTERVPREYTFIPPHPIGDYITISFSSGQFHLTGNSNLLPQVIEEFTLLHPSLKSNTTISSLPIATFLIHPNSSFEEVFTPYLAEHAIPA